MSKIGGVIVSHGQVANELLAAAETVVGDLSHITAVSIGWHDDVELAKDEIARAIKKVSAGSGDGQQHCALALGEREQAFVTRVRPAVAGRHGPAAAGWRRERRRRRRRRSHGSRPAVPPARRP